ncbi:MAG: carbonic anhydrase [Terrimonas sp.]|uniref:carbonic anhydrase n=1 Tax=Terrimonas sp. TaxID=1914338 RepID=UPI00092A697D|nr:carbonic anhydrase [Terrimonas sp.]MBN8789983.1 carbonic anhydrase [Terrimonas sp.]OJY81340.1 MAG: carbonic anhydrase [Sphingobacteriales bacterium 40-81]PVD51419.1 carbonic anhydrase [Terrimonas sp.]
MKSYEQLLEANKEWASNKLSVNPRYFKKLAEVQKPEFLWIGCSDSRVPANEITGTEPGEIFVHRNIANMVVHTDVNLLSVLEYAVKYLEVKHVIICGHYGCGGVKAAMGNEDFNQVLNMWLRVIKDVYRNNREELDAIEDMNARSNRLVELNVIEQAEKICKTSTIQNAWKERKGPDIHAWVYDLKDGLINPILEIKAGTPIDSLYKYEFA